MWISVITLVLLVAAALAVISVFRYNWHYGLKTNDQAVIINTVMSACALALVGWGVIVALAAYVSATGRPDLRPEITFTFSLPNRPVFQAEVDSPDPGGFFSVQKYKQTKGHLVIHNKSKYAARNPGVLLEFEGFGLVDTDLTEWRTVSTANMIGVRSIQWDGADFMIHGKWSRKLPALDFQGLTALSLNPELAISIVADGLTPRTWRFPIKILGPVDYKKYTSELVEHAGPNKPLSEAPPSFS
jgi:hypothetical protein